jgi:hypothetical protein
MQLARCAASIAGGAIISNKPGHPIPKNTVQTQPAMPLGDKTFVRLRVNAAMNNIPANQIPHNPNTANEAAKTKKTRKRVERRYCIADCTFAYRSCKTLGACGLQDDFSMPHSSLYVPNHLSQCRKSASILKWLILYLEIRYPSCYVLRSVPEVFFGNQINEKQQDKATPKRGKNAICSPTRYSPAGNCREFCLCQSAVIPHYAGGI